ncbi:MAG: hypothetical protein FWE05_11895 [Defluviitaleaceae bacterium]|nr:hypothetical protein [Defluviitaleaceae bacterium]
MAEDKTSLLHDKIFASYILTDEASGIRYPSNDNLMFVSLQKLANEGCEAGELARYFLGKESDPKSESVRKVKAYFDKGYSVFKADKEAVERMTVYDKYRSEGYAEGEEVGIEKGMEMMLRKAIERGKSLDVLREMADDANISYNYLQQLIEEIKLGGVLA